MHHQFPGPGTLRKAIELDADWFLNRRQASRACGEGRGSEDAHRALKDTIRSMASLAEKKNAYTAGHQQRVAQLSAAVARELGLADPKIEEIWTAARIHDIGMINVPAEILGKSRKLDALEFRLIQDHPSTGFDVLKDIKYHRPIARTVAQHHERLNGTGYPRGLLEKDISLEARIVGVADVVEAMCSHRPYRPAWGVADALAEIKKNRGIQFDPEVVTACCRLFLKRGFRFR